MDDYYYYTIITNVTFFFIAIYILVFQLINMLYNLSFQFVDLGMVTSIEYNHKSVESARKGQEVCIKIEPVPGEAPKMFGRHFEAKDFLVSKVSASVISWSISILNVKKNDGRIVIRGKNFSTLKSNIVNREKINTNKFLFSEFIIDRYIIVH